jgi:prepilin-type N-terminal cleavage/methylation domain-containing protein
LPSRPPKTRFAAFTMLEVLVAMTVLTILIFLLARLLDSTR